MSDYPEVSLAYMHCLTDCTGIIQHGHHSVPNRHLGYTTDDNSRALIVAAQHYALTGDRDDLWPAINYLSFLHHAHTPDKRFRNIMSYQREWLDQQGTEDCFGRCMWACGHTASSALPENIRIVARKLFDESTGWIGDLISPRARAYCMLGMFHYLKANEDQADLRDKMSALADSLNSGCRRNDHKDWYWYEDYLTYGNAILPMGMVAASHVTGEDRHADTLVRTLDFLTETVMIDGRLEIIGNNGWYTRGENRAFYDQQSIDAGYLVLLYSMAYELLGDRKYLDLAFIAFDWFFGHNRSGCSVYDPITHGCFDAIIPEGVNLNQGAESCVALLLAQMTMIPYISADPGP